MYYLLKFPWSAYICIFKLIWPYTGFNEQDEELMRDWSSPKGAFIARSFKTVKRGKSKDALLAPYTFGSRDRQYTLLLCLRISSQKFNRAKPSPEASFEEVQEHLVLSFTDRESDPTLRRLHSHHGNVARTWPSMVGMMHKGLQIPYHHQ